MLIRRGEYAAALAISERMMQVVNRTQNPEMRSYAAAAQGNALMAMREFERAQSAAEDYIAVDPLGPQGYLRMAYVLNAMHDYDQALIYADKGIARGSLHSHGQRIVALCLTAAGSAKFAVCPAHCDWVAPK